MGILYHGSKTSNLTVLVPKDSTHGKYVYATNKELALIFSARCGDDLTRSLFRNSLDEPWNLVERVPNAFSLMFNTTSSLYEVDDTSFRDIKTGFSELASSEPVRVLHEEKIDNLYSKIEELEELGLIRLYRYPNKPKFIPSNDMDLLEKNIKWINSNILPLKRESFERLLFLHPSLLDEINQYGSKFISNFIPFKKEELVELFEKNIKLQKSKPNHEFFISSAYMAITTAFPELTALLDEKTTQK